MDIAFHLRYLLQNFPIQEHLIPAAVALLSFLGILVQTSELSQMLTCMVEVQNLQGAWKMIQTDLPVRRKPIG